MSMDLDTQHFGEDGEYGTPKRRRRAPARIIFGGDDDREMWTWECRREHTYTLLPVFDDVSTFAEAITALEEHVYVHHRDLPTKVGSLISNIYDKLFFLTDKGWIGISGHTFYDTPGAYGFTVLHEGTEERQ